MNAAWFRNRWMVALVVCLTAAGCEKREAHEEEHEEGHKVGTHGGPLVELSDEAARTAGIAVDSVGPRAIGVVVDLPGEIKLDAERSVEVRPSYPGRILRLHAGLGAFVRQGQTLAAVYSNESLSEYTIEAPMAGTVVARPVNPGAAVDPASVIYTLANLSSVWLDFPIYVRYLGSIHQGQTVRVQSQESPGTFATGTISYIGPMLDVDTRATFGRVVLPNADRRWQPGRLVTASVVLERFTAPMAVPEEAIVREGSGAAVFRATPQGFELQSVTPGRSDGVMTEILSGLEPGARVATRNAFLLKAELEKEAGGHDD
ncbi:MAG TPA: efflux RND transporter periplasmic adaptor subunit [Candidatus Eisenbacteria bacterium]|jgi:cobalt-zinc-cadmium efflux system membrane fusion protein|nr:efflux RND transporter periplasmic adaptor subunit [Candidatus Eisenbacteria bacterium]